MARNTYRTEIRTTEDLTGVRKAAVLLVALQQETAARILKGLDRENLRDHMGLSPSYGLRPPASGLSVCLRGLRAPW